MVGNVVSGRLVCASKWFDRSRATKNPFVAEEDSFAAIIQCLGLAKYASLWRLMFASFIANHIAVVCTMFV